MTAILGGRDKMRNESKFSTWIRTGGQSSFVLPFTSLVSLETKFSVVPDRLLDSIIDDALAVAVTRLNQYQNSETCTNGIRVSMRSRA